MTTIKKLQNNLAFYEKKLGLYQTKIDKLEYKLLFDPDSLEIRRELDALDSMRDKLLDKLVSIENELDFLTNNQLVC